MKKPKLTELGFRKTRNTIHFAKLETMPPLNHWPDRPQPFSFERSEVIGWIMQHCAVNLIRAVRVWDSAHSAKIIKFNPTAQLWEGCKHQTPANEQ